MAYIPNKVHRSNLKEPAKKNWLKNPEDAKFYNSRKWRRFSLAYKMSNPVCINCTQPSYYTDHIKPISEGGDKWDYKNLQPLCKSCNASKTAKQNKRSFPK